MKTPFLDNAEMAKIKALQGADLHSEVLPMLFQASHGPDGLERAMDDLFRRADEAIERGVKILVLSDRGVSREWAPIPALLAVAGLQNHLVRERRRTRVGLVLETGEPREAPHCSLLIGYVAGAINPYLAIETLAKLHAEGALQKEISLEEAVAQ